METATVASELAVFGEWLISLFQLLPPAVSAAFFFLFAFIVFFGILRMVL